MEGEYLECSFATVAISLCDTLRDGSFLTIAVSICDTLWEGIALEGSSSIDGRLRDLSADDVRLMIEYDLVLISS